MHVIAITLLSIAIVIGSVDASTGQLEVLNVLKDWTGSNCIYMMDHWEGSSEGYNPGPPDLDTDYAPLFTPSGLKAKIVSEVEGHELEYDSRPIGNVGLVLELSLHSQSGSSITILSGNELRFIVDPSHYGWDFGIKPITLELDNGQRYDVRQVIAAHGGIVPLADLEGTYNSEEVYATPELHFRHVADLDNDGDVDLCDYSVLAQNWSGSGGALTGDISGPDGIPDGAVDVDDVTALVDNMTGPQ